MADVTDLLTSTTPDATTLPGIDLDGLVRAGTRRRLAKRAAAAVLSLALLGGGVTTLSDIADRQPELQIMNSLPIDSWAELPAAPIGARVNPLVTSLDDDRIVVVGGLTGGTDGMAGTTKADGAVLDAARSSWELLPTAPFGDAATVSFTVRDTTLWAHEVLPSALMDGSSDGSTLPSVQLATLDLNAISDGWELLEAAPVSWSFSQVVTVLDDTVVVFGGDDSARTSMLMGDRSTAGAIWRDGSWTAFGSAPHGDVASSFVGIGDDYLAIAGGEGQNGVVDDAALLDLETASWRAVDPLPLGARADGTFVGLNALVIDGRMLVLDGMTEANSEAVCSSTTTDAACLDESSPSIHGGAWLDLASGTWEVAELPFELAGDVTQTPSVMPDSADGLTPPTSMVVRPDGTDARFRLDLDGTWRDLRDQVPAGTFWVDTLDDDPVLSIAVAAPYMNDTSASVWSDQMWRDVTVAGSVEGVSYAVIDDTVFAFGGRPYSADGSAGAERVYDDAGPLIAMARRR